MANSTSSFSSSTSPPLPPPCPLLDNPVALSAASSSSGGFLDDDFEDACSICLEPFTTQDPATVTSCRHEYHLQCILEWSQRSKECPICWQLFVLKDPASQELLNALDRERLSRSSFRSPAVSTIHHHHQGDFDAEEDTAYSDDSDFDEHIMQHLAAAASRAHYVRRRERQRPSGHGAPEVLVFTPPAIMPCTQRRHAISPDDSGNFSYDLQQSDSVSPGIPSVNVVPQSPVTTSANMVSSVAVNADGNVKSRQPQLDNARTQSSSEVFSFSESIRSKWSAASAKYKESISKGTRGLKEKLLARNNSVREMSKGVQREMSAGVARMIERMDLAAKRSGAPVPASGSTGGFRNSLFKGKGVQENVTTESLSKSSARGPNSDALSHASTTILDQVEVSHSQRGR